MATLTLEGSADQDQADNGSLQEEGEDLVTWGDDERESAAAAGGQQPRTIAQCCKRCATIVQVYSKHRYERERERERVEISIRDIQIHKLHKC